MCFYSPESPIILNESLEDLDCEIDLVDEAKKIIKNRSDNNNKKNKVTESRKMSSNEVSNLCTIIIKISSNKQFSDLAKNNYELAKYLDKYASNYERSSLTNAGDLVIVCDDTSKNSILNNSECFNGCEKTVMSFDKRPIIYLYGFTAAEIQNSMEIKNSLSKEGITFFEEPINKNLNKQSQQAIKGPSKLIKLVCKNEETQLRLICSDIQIANKQYEVEPALFIKQCKKCNIFDHIDCSSAFVCCNCNNRNDSFIKCHLLPFCVNCKGKHSAKYKGCPEYKKRKAEQIHAFKIKLIERTKTPIEKVNEWSKLSRKNFDSNAVNQTNCGNNYYQLKEEDSSLLNKYKDEYTDLKQLIRDSYAQNAEIIKTNKELTAKIDIQLNSLSQKQNEDVERLDKKIDENYSKTYKGQIKMMEKLIDCLLFSTENKSAVKTNFLGSIGISSVATNLPNNHISNNQLINGQNITIQAASNQTSATNIQTLNNTIAANGLLTNSTSSKPR